MPPNGSEQMSDATPQVSIVIEWEHVTFRSSGRATAMLEQLKRQVPEMGIPVEVILVYDPAHTDTAEIETILERAGVREAAGLEFRTEATPGLRYYGMKNEGAERSRGPIVVILDSDVIPEDGWLRAIIEPFADESVQVVAGNTYIRPESTYDKAFALFWMFSHLDRDGAPPEQQAAYHANNVAFRREVLQRHPWPVGTTLSPNMEHLATLRRAGISIAFAAKTRALHPSPSGLADMTRYAFSSGYDRAFPRLAGLASRLVWLVATPVGLAIDLWHSARLILPAARRRAVGLTAGEIPQALALAALYALLKSTGYVVTIFAPGLVERRFSTGSSLAGSQAVRQPAAL